MPGSLHSEEGRRLLERIRRRYLLLKIDCEKPPSEKDFLNALRSSITRLFGEYGASQTEVILVEYNPEMKYAIIRCPHKSLPVVRASIATITKVAEEPIAVHVLLVSGTLKALRKKMQKYLY